MADAELKTIMFTGSRTHIASVFCAEHGNYFISSHYSDKTKMLGKQVLPTQCRKRIDVRYDFFSPQLVFMSCVVENVIFLKKKKRERQCAQLVSNPPGL